MEPTETRLCPNANSENPEMLNEIESADMQAKVTSEDKASETSPEEDEDEASETSPDEDWTPASCDCDCHMCSYDNCPHCEMCQRRSDDENEGSQTDLGDPVADSEDTNPGIHLPKKAKTRSSSF